MRSNTQNCQQFAVYSPEYVNVLHMFLTILPLGSSSGEARASAGNKLKYFHTSSMIPNHNVANDRSLFFWPMAPVQVSAVEIQQFSIASG